MNEWQRRVTETDSDRSISCHNGSPCDQHRMRLLNTRHNWGLFWYAEIGAGFRHISETVIDGGKYRQKYEKYGSFQYGKVALAVRTQYYQLQFVLKVVAICTDTCMSLVQTVRSLLRQNIQFTASKFAGDSQIFRFFCFQNTYTWLSMYAVERSSQPNDNYVISKWIRFHSL